jgi:hypothetical protein
MYSKFVVGLLSSYDFIQDRANAFQQSERLPWTGIRAPQQRYACIERFHFRRSAKSSSGNIYLSVIHFSICQSILHQYEEETKKMREQIDELRTTPRIFQSRNCHACMQLASYR